VVYDEKHRKWKLKKAKNLAKDQTYVLYFLTQEQLARTRFPLGEFESKDAVRAVAERYGFDNAHKKDSQDICFVPDGKYADFIRNRTGRDYSAGNFVDRDGNVLGEHKGIIGYTIGQRKGLGLSLPAPLYVCRKNVADNTVVLAPETALYTRRLWAEDFNWIAGDVPTQPVRAAARTRYSAKEAPATVTVRSDGRVEILFDEPQRAVTEGQAVVLYSGDEVLGGGTICGTEENE
jgi:tRNA-specific 2-thiouridylase